MKFAAVDCETDPAKWGRVPQPFIWGYYDGETYEQFDTELELVTFLYHRKEIAYAHNGGKFDWHYLLDFVEPYTPVKVISGRIAEFKIGECTFRDSLSIVPRALSEFQKEDFDYTILEKDQRDKPHNRKKIERYLYSDCYNLFHYILKPFMDRFGYNLTLAGTAMRQWQGISGRELPKDAYGQLYEQFKRFYYGGRCEAFETGIIDQPFVMADINSAYPYAMLRPHPYGTDFVAINQWEWENLKPREQGPCFVTVRCASTGALPYRAKDNSLFFPNDNVVRTFSVTGWELLAALDTHAISVYEWVDGYSFIDLQDFSLYINQFYEERLQAKAAGDKSLALFCKLMMNALYGKYGANPENYANYQVIEPTLLEEGFYHDEERMESWLYSGPFGSNVLVAKDLEEYEQRYYNVATAASITGFVRAFLWRALSQCHRPLYCDTDSIAAIRINDLPNGLGDQLGQWAWEGDSNGRFKRGAIGGRKLYAFQYNQKKAKYKMAHKGVKLTSRQLFKIARGGQVIYRPDFPVFSVHKAPHFMERKVSMTKKVLSE